MKSEYLEKYEPLRDYYESGNLRNETYLIHMVSIIYRYSDSINSNLISISINGIEYPPDTELEFDLVANKLTLKKT